jgi:hypothetical protein
MLKLPPPARVKALRFGFAATYDDVFGWRTWTQSLAQLLWTHLTAPDTRVVGWNIDTYDLHVVRNAVHDDEPVTTLDLAAEIKAATSRDYRLDTVARANLGRGKILDTPLVVGWLRAGDGASMTQVTEHCRNNVQLAIDLLHMVAGGQPLMLPGRLQPGENGWFKTSEATLRLWFRPDGRWLRCEELRGRVLRERTDES